MEQPTASHQGWVKKKNIHTNTWHRRYMALIENNLHVYKKPEDPNNFSVYELSKDVYAALISSSMPPKFQIIGIKNDPIYFVTNSVEEANNWVININISAYKGANYVLEDFNIIRLIGIGYYGKVFLVQKKTTDEVYALKAIRKSRLVEGGKVDSIISEKNIMLSSKHPFIIKLCFAFQTNSKFYLGMEYGHGGELFNLMEKTGTLNVNDVRLYVAEIALALDFMHSKDIIYRDLKPENVLLDSNGHIKITDFGLSKNLEESQTTSTFCGTSEYLAPEIIMQKPYSFPIDFWALGILTYEMLFGATPFVHENKTKMYSSILALHPHYPHGTDLVIVNFINKLLSKDPNQRHTFQTLKNDPFLGGFDWDKVYNKEYVPSYIPNINNPLDTQNFDEEFTSQVPADSFVSNVTINVPGFSFTQTSFT